MMSKQFSVAAIVLGVAIAAQAWAAPEPSIVTTSWQLDFTHKDPAIIAVRLSGEDKPRLYYYMTYTVANRTGEDQLFVPDVWMFTDAGDLMQANRGVPPAVFRAIKQHEENPLLEEPMKIVGKILQGRDNARDGVVVWEVPEHDVDSVRIFIGGLSGETHEITDPTTGEKKLLRKTLMLEYHSPGDRSHVRTKPFVLKDTQWIVR